MATNGVKIIDGDLARDTYTGILDLYDGGASVEAIRAGFPFRPGEPGQAPDFDHEMFVAAYALAFWEIGELTPEVLAEVRRVIAAQAGVSVWSEEADAATGKKRRQALARLQQKISLPNPKPRPRKRYRRITNLFFQAGDVLAFQVRDATYRAAVCVAVTQHRGQCTYDLAATTYQGSVPPTPADLRAGGIIGRRIGSGYAPAVTLAQQPGVAALWQYAQKTNFFFGVCYCLVTHPAMATFKEKVEKVGELFIKEPFRKSGSYGYSASFEQLENSFLYLAQPEAPSGPAPYPVALLCEGE